jgi:hypothetical protein
MCPHGPCLKSHLIGCFRYSDSATGTETPNHRKPNYSGVLLLHEMTASGCFKGLPHPAPRTKIIALEMLAGNPV